MPPTTRASRIAQVVREYGGGTDLGDHVTLPVFATDDIKFRPPWLGASVVGTPMSGTSIAE